MLGLYLIAHHIRGLTVLVQGVTHWTEFVNRFFSLVGHMHVTGFIVLAQGVTHWT